MSYKDLNSDPLWKCAAFGQVRINVLRFICPRFRKTIRETNLEKLGNAVSNLQKIRWVCLSSAKFVLIRTTNATFIKTIQSVHNATVTSVFCAGLSNRMKKKKRKCFLLSNNIKNQLQYL